MTGLSGISGKEIRAELVRTCGAGYVRVSIVGSKEARSIALALASVRRTVGSRAGAPVWPGGPDPHHVSSPLHVARNVRISRIARPICFTPKLMGPILLGRLSACRVALDER
jgi:hypothetical protein